jgi:hypothetical protein
MINKKFKITPAQKEITDILKNSENAVIRYSRYVDGNYVCNIMFGDIFHKYHFFSKATLNALIKKGFLVRSEAPDVGLNWRPTRDQFYKLSDKFLLGG